jgi:metallo-beta-lactamase family protein
MKVTLLGAAGVVTGSAYLVETDQARVLVDFGMFQGSHALEQRNVLPEGLDPARLDAVLVTHAHLDHTGRLPLLARHGYGGPIYATDATIDMAELILLDAAKIQESDAERENRKRRHQNREAVQPLYTANDADAVLKLMRVAPYHQALPVATGVSVRYVDSGHMLGSTSIEMTVEEGGQRKVVIFSGDLGPAGMAWLRDAETFQRADLVFLESTYGDRDHRPLAATLDEGREIVLKAMGRNGKILVPSFAIGRTQQLLYHMAGLFRSNEVEKFPIFVDSPMAIKATKIYIEHPELYDDEAIALAKEGHFAQDLNTVKATPKTEQSIAINSFEGTCMVISASGMCTGGRIVHHLRHNLARPETSVIIVGYQAHGSLGRELVDGAEEVRIFGETIPVRADIHTLGGFSAHAGQTDLLRWFDVVAGSKPRVVLTHGEERQRDTLAGIIRQRYGLEVALPMDGDQITL